MKDNIVDFTRYSDYVKSYLFSYPDIVKIIKKKKIPIKDIMHHFKNYTPIHYNDLLTTKKSTSPKKNPLLTKILHLKDLLLKKRKSQPKFHRL